MKIKFSNYKGTFESELCDYIDSELHRISGEYGAVEMAQKTCNNVIEAFSRLCEVLAKNNLLALGEIGYIINGYDRDEFVIVEE